VTSRSTRKPATGLPIRRPAALPLQLIWLAALIGGVALLAGCGDSGNSDSGTSAETAGPSLSASVRVANCTDWKHGSVEQRRNTVIQLRAFSGGPIGSSAGMQNGRTFDDLRAYNVLESFCKRRFARAFKLYKLYTRAAGFAGPPPGPTAPSTGL